MDIYILKTFFLTLLVLFLTLLLCSLMRQIWLQRTPSTTSTPPSPPRLPIIGHLHLITDMPHHAFAHLAQKFGPIVHLQLGLVPAIIISSAQIARLVLKTQDHIFATRPRLSAPEYLSHDLTFSPYGPYWRQVRKICIIELLSLKRIKSFQFIRDEEVSRLLAAVSARCGSEVDISDLFFSLSSNILFRVVFGRRFADGLGSEGKKRHLVALLTETEELFSGFSLGDFFPGWKWVNSLNGYTRKLTKNLEALRSICDEIIDEHLQKREGQSPEREDFVDVLLRMKQREELELPMTDDNIRALLLDMLVAGTDTSLGALEWTTSELVRNPETMKKAQEEVRNVASVDGRVEDSHLQHLQYIKAAVKEALRLHPPVPLLVPRESMEECMLEGYKIPVKTRVIINAYAIGRDPDSWENPLEYAPERFLDSNVGVKDQDFRFIPFGGGRRGCPGYNFSLATVEIALARLLFHFDWTLPQGVHANEMDLGEMFGLTTRKKTALVLVPTAKKGSGFNPDLY